MRPRLLQLPLAALILAAPGAARAQPEPLGQVRWQPVAEQGPANRTQALAAPASSRPHWQPVPGSAAAPSAGAVSAGGPSVVWSPVPANGTAARAGITPGRGTPQTNGSAITVSPSTPSGGSGPTVVWRPLTPEEARAIVAITSSGATPGTPGVPGKAAGQSGSNTPPLQPPTSPQQAEALSQSLAPVAADYTPQLRLGPAVPTANQLGAQQGQVSAYQLAPLAGGGAAGGSGNQDYVFNLDLGLTDRLQLSAFYSDADDPLFAQINGKSPNPANFWETYGAALQWQLIRSKAWALAINGSLGAWNVGSGGCDSFSSLCGGKTSPNIFNNSGTRVFTRNLVGSLALPLTWQATSTLQLTFTPGASFLPATQGEGQGGAGTFYGTNITLAAGAAWRPIPQVTLFGSGLVPLGPGNNSFNSDLVFQRVPILTAGVNWALNPRIGLEAALTNGWGGTPAVAALALPSSNQLNYLVRFLYSPGAADTPQQELTPRQRSIALGGLTVNTALVPPAGRNELWASVDSGGNLFGFYGYSLSNIFQLELYKGGYFNTIPQTNVFADTYANSGAPQWRLGGRAVALSPLRGFPIWVGGRISVGREYPPGSGQGYAFAESILTWEANRWLALNLNPKLGWSGVGTPWALGIGANLQLGPSFQLIPEANLVGSDLSQSNGTLALRWLASDLFKLDLYVGNAGGLLDMGQLLGLPQVRVGGRVIVSF